MDPPDAEHAPRFEDHLPWAIRIALAIVGRQAAFRDREDAIQEALLALHRAIEKFDRAKGDDFRAYAQRWVSGAVRRTLKNDRRRRAVEIVFEGEEELYAALEGTGDPWSRINSFAREAVDAIAGASQMAAAVARLDQQEDAGEMIARLDPDEQRLIELKYRQGLPWKEVGAALGIKVRAAKYRDAKLQTKLALMLEGRRG